MDPTSRRLFMTTSIQYSAEITSGTASYISFSDGRTYFYMGYGVSGTLLPAAGGQSAGSLVGNGQFTISGTTYTLRAFFDRTSSPPSPASHVGSFFGVLGNKVGTWWTTVTANSVTYNRTTNFINPTGTYNSASNMTYWQTNNGSAFNLGDATNYGIIIT